MGPSIGPTPGGSSSAPSSSNSTPASGAGIGPQLPGSGGDGTLRKVDAPKSGTKWHKENLKKWYINSRQKNHIYLNKTEASGHDTQVSVDFQSAEKLIPIFYYFRYEAKSDEGHIYFWHVETNESRWDPPPDGYLSIKEQEEINQKHEEKETKKIYNMYQSQSIHGRHKDETEVAAEAAETMGPQAKPSPYGAWQTVDKG